MTAESITWRRRLATALVATTAALSLLGLHAAAGESATAELSASRAASERIADFEFQPTPLRVGAGTRVVFANRSSVAHTATQNGRGFDTGTIKPGKAASVTFRRAGTYLFHCSIHPFMHGKIVVE
jgi:plastocyanin